MLDLATISKQIQMLISDFDGVFTDNKVYVDSSGNELVTCSKSDSLGIDFYLKNRKLGKSNFDFIVVSTETNPVVMNRCKKLGLKAYTGIADKETFLAEMFNSQRNASGKLEGFLYLGNDLNDLAAINLCQYSAAPSDAHRNILDSVGYVSAYGGGNGFIRDVLTQLLD